MGINPADNLTAPQAIETIRQLLKLSGSRGRDNNWLLNEIAKHVSKFTPLAELAARREPGPGPVPGDRAMAGALRERILKALNECGTSIRANNPGNVADYLMTEVLDRAAAIERSQTPGPREVVVDSPREARNENETS
jgi:hypothetical protein